MSTNNLHSNESTSIKFKSTQGKKKVHIIVTANLNQCFMRPIWSNFTSPQISWLLLACCVRKKIKSATNSETHNHQVTKRNIYGCKFHVEWACLESKENKWKNRGIRINWWIPKSEIGRRLVFASYVDGLFKSGLRVWVYHLVWGCQEVVTKL